MTDTDDPRAILAAAGVECPAELVKRDEMRRELLSTHNRIAEVILASEYLCQTDAVILVLARLVVPLYRLLQAERALENPDVMEGTTHMQTAAHLELRAAYLAACQALGVESFVNVDPNPQPTPDTSADDHA